MNRYVIKCKTLSGAQLYFCHQVIAGTQQINFVTTISHALLYNDDEINDVELYLIKVMKAKKIKSYKIINLEKLPKNKKSK